MSHENYTRHNVLQEGGLGESIGRSGEEEGPESLDGAGSSAAACDGAARSLRQWFNLVMQSLASCLSTRPVVHSLLVWIYCLRDLSSELTTFQTSTMLGNHMDLWSTALAEKIYCVELTSLGTPISGTIC